MRRITALVVTAAAGCQMQVQEPRAGDPRLSADLDTPITCATPLVVGQPHRASMSWRAPGATATATAWCEGGACNTSVSSSRAYGYDGTFGVTFFPTRPGPIEGWIEVQLADGTTERYRLLSCPATAPPDVTFVCTVRDRRTGAFEPCGATVEVGADVHVDVTGTIDPAQATALLLDPPVVFYDDSPGDRDRFECTREEQTGDHWRVHCATIALAGTHAFSAHFHSDAATKTFSFTSR